MIDWNHNDASVATYAAEYLTDQMLDNPNEWDNCDDISVKKLAQLGANRGLLVTGDVVTVDEAAALMKQVVLTEINSWVSDSSQRLIYRAARALSIDTPYFRFLGCTDDADHGPAPQDHALIQDWVCGIYTMRCATCGHLYRV